MMASADSHTTSPAEDRNPAQAVESANVHHCRSYICFLKVNSPVLLHDLLGYLVLLDVIYTCARAILVK